MGHLTQEKLKSILFYNPETGVFYNKKTNQPVGWHQSGYLKYAAQAYQKESQKLQGEYRWAETH